MSFCNLLPISFYNDSWGDDPIKGASTTSERFQTFTNPEVWGCSIHGSFHGGVSRDIYMGVSKNRGVYPPKWMVKIMENPIKMDDLGGTPILGNTHIYIWEWGKKGLCLILLREELC